MKELSEVSIDHLKIRGVDLVDLCDKYGTPLFVFDESLIRENCTAIRNAFGTRYPSTITAYSIKTNYNLAVCSIIREEGAYANVATGLDFYVAKKAGFPYEHMIVDGLRLHKTELCEVLKNEVLVVNVETLSELGQLDKLAGEMGVKQNIGIRVNLAERKSFFREVFDNEALQCYPSSRFGFSLQDAYTAFEQASRLKNLNFVGIMTHPFRTAKTLLPFVNQIRKELGIKIQFLDLGGGFSKSHKVIRISDLVKDLVKLKLGFRSNLDKKNGVTNLQAIAESITTTVKQTLNDTPTIILEPGRYIINDAGLLLLRVECIKAAGRYKWIITDGGTNLVPDYWERREIQVADRQNAQPKEIVNVVGPLLYPDDFIAIKKCLPEIQVGGILAVSDAGAYTLSQSNQFLYPRPGAVLLGSDGEVKEIRGKETYEDVLLKDAED